MKINGILIFILVILLNPEVKPQGTSLKMLLPDPSFMPGWYFLKQQECYKGDEARLGVERRDAVGDH